MEDEAGTLKEFENMVETVGSITEEREADGCPRLRCITVLTDIIIFGDEIVSAMAMKELKHCLIDLELEDYNILRYVEIIKEAKDKN